MRSIRVAFVAALSILATCAALAGSLSDPQGQVVLTVSGSVGNVNGDGVAEFDRAMLENLDWREIETHTSFTTGPQTFAGPTLASLLEAVEAGGEMMKASAINDYFVEIPVAHASEHDVLLAMDMNGKQMRVRDKGPVWVVYPLTPEQTLEKPFDTEMIWQLNRIEVLK